MLDFEVSDVDGDGMVVVFVLVWVCECQLYWVGFGVGFSFNIGVCVEFNYYMFNFFNWVWELNSGVWFEQKWQIVFVDVFLLLDVKNCCYGFGVIVEISDIQGFKIECYVVGVQIIQQCGSVEQWLLLNWQEECWYLLGVIEIISWVLVLNVMWIWWQVDNLFDLCWGIVFQVQVGGGVKVVFFDQNFFCLYGCWQ